ncbi:hypothetical protein PAXINDRAFT_83836, partial [Paxillus involutus ATCC 200175]
TKCAANGENTQCAPQNCVTDPQHALDNHFRVNPTSPNSHLFAWRHPQSGLHPLSKSEVTKRITAITMAHNLDNLKGHSLRIRGTLFYLLKGIPFNVVKVMGRWTGDSFTLYLRHHALILAPFLQDEADIMNHFKRYVLPPVR